MIRGTDADSAAQDAIVLDLADLHRQGEQILERAREQAARIVEEGRAERRRLVTDAARRGIEQGMEEGKRRGYEAGRELGRREALDASRKEASTVIGAWRTAIESFDRVRADSMEHAQDEMLKLALAIAERVTKRAIEADPAAALPQLECALEMVMEPSRLRIQVNPEDRAVAEDVLPELLERIGGSPHTEVVDDPSLARGSCVVRTDHGEIDASIESQIERIAGALLGVGGRDEGGGPA